MPDIQTQPSLHPDVVTVDVSDLMDPRLQALSALLQAGGYGTSIMTPSGLALGDYTRPVVEVALVADRKVIIDAVRRAGLSVLRVESASDPSLPPDFEHRLDLFKAQKEHNPSLYRQAMRQIHDEAIGVGNEGVHEQCYAGWTKRDLRLLLAELGEGPLTMNFGFPQVPGPNFITLLERRIPYESWKDVYYLVAGDSFTLGQPGNFSATHVRLSQMKRGEWLTIHIPPSVECDVPALREKLEQLINKSQLSPETVR